MIRRDFGKLSTMEGRTRRISFINLFALLLAGVISSFWSSAFAQTAEFSGRVLDQNNAAVAGAVVTLTKTDGTVRQTITTGSGGAFSFENPPAGSYRLLVSRQGFAVQEQALELPLSGASLDVVLKPDATRLTVTVTAEGDSFAAVEAVSATRLPLSLSELPQSVSVVDRAVIDSQQSVRLTDVARNLSGVERDAAFFYDATSQFTIRGVTLDLFNSYYRDGFRYDGGTPVEIANVQQFEVLKGPASVIYGRTEPGGIINLVTAKPSPQSYQTMTFQAGRFGLYRPQFDSTGSLTGSGNLLYRVAGLYGHNGSYTDFVNSHRYFLAPYLLWKASPRTSVSFDGEYLKDTAVTNFGLVAVGGGPAPIPIKTFLDEPWNRGKYHGKWAGAEVNHQFTNNWSIRNGARYTFFNWDFYDVYPLFLSDDRTLNRQVEDANYPRRFFDNQTDVNGTFNTGALRHTLLFGFELSRQSIRQHGQFADVTPIDIYQPVYISRRPPPRATFIFPNAPGFLDLNAQQLFTSLGGYAQDQVSVGRKVSFNVALRLESYRQRYRDFGLGTDNRQRDLGVVPRAGFVYHPAESVSLYAGFSRSYSPAVATLLTAGGKPLKPEHGTQYEGGVKWFPFSGRLSMTAAGYVIRVGNVLTQDPLNPLFSIQSGEQQSKGFEFDLDGKIASGWNALFNYSFTQATVTKDNLFPVGNLLPNAPRHSANLWTIYELRRGRFAGFGFGGGVFARSKRVGDSFNSFFLPGYARVDATTFYSFGQGKGETKRYRFAVNVQNLLNRKYYESGRTAVIVFPGSPVNVVTEFQVRF
jgi:iron complex outermembrane receptor protein